MTDRELIDLAAKAAGIEGYYDEGCGLFIRDEDRMAKDWYGASVFDPLGNSGDCLRLAAELLIDIEWKTEYIVFADGNFSEDIKDHGNDHAAAIRRAIVRAAAEIGEKMQ